MTRGRAASLASGVFIAGLVGAPAPADDTEIYVTGFDTPAVCEAPNVLFMVDSSSSMDAQLSTQAPWDPDQAFSGCYDSDALYYSATGDIPDCESDRVVAKADNFCAAADERLALVGRFKDLYRRWNAARERWETLDPDLPAGPVDCESDRGLHGDGSGGEVFAADGPDGPWSSASDTEPAWASASNVTLFDGNWLNWNASPPSVTRTRLEVAQDAINSVIDSTDELNVAIMRFNERDGGPVLFAMQSLETGSEAAKSVVNGIDALGLTPLSETLFEAGQYLAGRPVDFGNVGPQLSVPESRTGANPAGANYNSPLQSTGQKSFVVILTDGEPADDTGADDKIRSLPGFAGLIGDDCDGEGDGRCLDDMAEYLFRSDLRGTVAGVQNVVTHTIGFTLDSALLESTAARGGGRYFVADDTASLTAALTELAESFEEDSAVFAAPAVPVNAFDRRVNAGDVYVSLFEPTNRVRWPGNLKKYRLASGDGTEDADPASLVDRFGAPAVDPMTGFFAEGTTSFWSQSPDGGDVRLGGAAGQLPDPGNRVLLTNVAGDDLGLAANRVVIDNPALTAGVIGAPADERDEVIEWIRGRDVRDEDDDGDRDEPRLAMGDPLHSRPVVVTYGDSAEAPLDTVFVTTNEGLLHAVDARSGEELWAFMPSRLLGRLYTLFSNNVAGTRDYGLDGEITVHIDGNDGLPGIDRGERVILLFGMRRGGDTLFAVDVTRRRDPQLLWAIDSRTAGYEDLGQTWSTPQVRRINLNGELRSVVLFGGGYDTGQDNRGFREDTVGNAVYMADLLTGERLWSAGRHAGHDLQLDRMRFSIPAALRIIDLDGDRLADRMYVGDMGGQLWRFDIVNGSPADALVEGGVLASLGAADLGNDPPATEIRRFYNTPDVVPIFDPRLTYLAVNIGSGYRAHPLDTATDEQFFSIRDFAAFSLRRTADFPPPLTVDDLADVTNDANPVLTLEDAGWRFGLVNGAGEKVLGRAITLAGRVVFTSFTPAPVGDACVPAGGTNRLYEIDVRNGFALTNRDYPLDERELTIEDRSSALSQGGIAPPPTAYFGDDGPAICVGVECFDLDDLPGSDEITSEPPAFIRSFWFQDTRP